MHSTRLARRFAIPSDGSSRLASKPVTAMTTSSSINVKAEERLPPAKVPVSREVPGGQEVLPPSHFRPRPHRRESPQLGRRGAPGGVALHAAGIVQVFALTRIGFRDLIYNLSVPPPSTFTSAERDEMGGLRHRTGHTQGQSMSERIGGRNPAPRGWFEFFRHSPGAGFTRGPALSLVNGKVL